MFYQKIIWTWVGILFLTNTEAQQHHFTNPQAHVQVTEETLNVSTNSYPDHQWEKVNPNRPKKQKFFSKYLAP